MSEKQEVLPRYTFGKSIKITDEDKKAVGEALDLRHMQKQEKPLPLTKEREKDINSLSKYQINWIKNNLGIDLSERSPDTDKIHFFTKETLEQINQRMGRNNSEGRHIAPYNEIHVEEKQTNSETLFTLSHEQLHSLSAIKLKLEVNQKDEDTRQLTIQKPYLYGYENTKNRNFFLLNECITEMINIEILDDMRKNEKPDYLTNNTIGYGHAVIFIDALINRTAQLSGQSEKEIRFSLYRGYFKGDHSALIIFKDIFGVEALRYLSILDNTHSSWHYIGIVAEKFGLDVEKLKIKSEQYVEQNQSVNIIEGIKIN